MNNQILYSILQYRHSLIAGEVLNVGILFSFPQEGKIKFVAGNLQRIKSIYPNFDINLPVKINTNINNKIIRLDSETDTLFTKKVIYSADTEESLNDYIKKYILLEDSTSLQFSTPFTAVDVFKDTQKTIDEYAKVLLPDFISKKDLNKHNEHFIIKQFSERLIKRNIVIEHRFSRNRVVAADGVKLNFDFAWKNGSTHLIKPISFDLKEEREIQSKSVQFYGYFDLLEKEAKRNDYVFDLLLWKPQDERLFKSYQNAIDVIKKAKAPLKIITEEELPKYTDDTAEELHKKDL